ncbi:MAG: dihydrolipoamide acetyltransferase family protein [Gemmatimonadaceae bacterium]
MATKVLMEALSPTMEEGRVSKWLKNVGDAVKSGETIAEVETDKAIMELVARGDGVLRVRLAEEGATAPVGQTIAVIGAPDEDISALTSGGGAAPAAATPVAATPAAAAPVAAPTAAPTPPPPPAAPPAAAPSAPAATAQHGDVVRSSPLARRLANEKGIQLQQVVGSGPNGRIIRRDVDAAIASPPAAASQAAAAAAAPSAASKPTTTPAMVIEGDYKDVALTQIRKTIARRLSESIGPIPTFYLTVEIDMTSVGELRESMFKANEQFKVSVNDIVMKAVALSLAQHPECNAHWLGDHIRYFSRVHLGMAVATDDGLIVPVIFDAHTKGLGAIGAEGRSLAKRARERKLTPAEYTGSTFSVSNLGMFGIDQFTAIINPPESAILAIGGLETKPSWENNAWVPRQKMRVTMSCDHRVIDGAVGAKFLQTLTQLLENPLRMMW